MKSQALMYFEAFTAHDLERLRPLLAADVHLRDWALDVRGLEAVLAANAAIFAAAPSIVVRPVNLVAEGNFVVGELDIVVSAEETIRVVDILEFDGDGRIRAIRAFKG